MALDTSVMQTLANIATGLAVLSLIVTFVVVLYRRTSHARFQVPVSANVGPFGMRRVVYVDAYAIAGTRAVVAEGYLKLIGTLQLQHARHLDAHASAHTMREARCGLYARWRNDVSGLASSFLMRQAGLDEASARDVVARYWGEHVLTVGCVPGPFEHFRVWLHNLFVEQAAAEREHAELMDKRGMEAGGIADPTHCGPSCDCRLAERS